MPITSEDRAGIQVLVYVFNPHSGLLTAHTTITAAGVGQILPAK